MVPIRQTTAFEVPFFAMDVNGDGVTGVADGSWTKRIKKSGAAWTAMTITVTEGENGWYHMTVGTGHTDTLGFLAISLSATGVKRVNLLFFVSARLLDDLSYPQTSGRAMVVSAAGEVDANVTQISGDTVAADNLESYADGTAFMPVDAHAPNFDVTGTTLTVKAPDGTTTAYTKTITTDANAEPITGAS